MIGGAAQHIITLHGSLEKIACGDFFETSPAFPPAKSVVFAACLDA
jgi:hypothetical protein